MVPDTEDAPIEEHAAPPPPSTSTEARELQRLDNTNQFVALWWSLNDAGYYSKRAGAVEKDACVVAAAVTDQLMQAILETMDRCAAPVPVMLL